MQKSLIGLSILLAAGTARADGFSHDDMVSLDSALKDVAPAPGVAKATQRAPSWCANVPAESGYSFSGILQVITGSNTLHAAKAVCSLPANEKAVQHAAAIVAQNWMNDSGLSQAEAETTIALRLDAGYDAGKTRLCKAIGKPPEADDDDGDPKDEEGLFRKTRLHLFGCDANDPAWMDDETSWHDLSAAFFDQSVTPPDQIVRLGYVLDRAKRAFEDPRMNNEKKYLTPYGADSIDYRELSDDGVKQMIEVAPYKGNVYAKATILESLARARMGIAILDARAQAFAAKDPDYKEALFDAPKRAVDEYNAAAKLYAAEIARSNQFEHDSHSPKRVAGCEATLRADFLKVYGTLKHSTKEEALASMSNPVASLLLQRLVSCMTIANQAVAADLQNLRVNQVRYARGPRSAAYFAIVDAIEKIHAERPKFPLSRDLLKGEEAVIGGGTRVTASGVQKGIVKSATKKGDVVHVVFVTTKVQVMNSTCSNTKHLLAVRDDGSLQYEQSCHNTGLAWEDTTPTPMDVPSTYATGLAPNTYAELSATALPIVIYKDKTKAKLLSFYGFPL